MKRKMMWLILLAVLLLTLPLLACAEKIVEVNDHIKCAAGEPWVGAYPDYASKIHWSLTKDDFDITYRSGSEYVTLNEDGSGYISAEAGTFNNLPVFITYTPKVEGVGEKTTFRTILRTTYPLKDLRASKGNLILGVGTGEEITISHPGTTDKGIIATFRYDPAIVTVTKGDEKSGYTEVTIKAIGAGQTNVDVVAYNGRSVTISVQAAGKPSKIELASASYACDQGDTIELGLDMGNGSPLYYPIMNLKRDGQYMERATFFPVDANHFYGAEPGYYDLTVTSHSVPGKEAKAQIAVYDRASCASIALSTGDLHQYRADTKVLLYDAQGNTILRPMLITAGEKIATLNAGKLYVTGMGDVTIAVTNPDGTVVIKTFPVIIDPTEIILNADELTLSSGDSFDLEVSFDQGSSDYSYEIDFDEDSPLYSLDCIRMEGDRIIAQMPGTATITIKAGRLQKTVRVTVLNDEKVISIVGFPEEFGANSSCQLAVQDKTGKVYPAHFEAYRDNGIISVTPEGLLTSGRGSGYFSLRITLEDGRVLIFAAEVLRIPTWLRYPAITERMREEHASILSIDSDVGSLSTHDVYVEVEDPRVARFNGNWLEFEGIGTTKVTLTAKHGGATTSFTLTVLPDDDLLYVGATVLELPYGYVSYLPVVTDADGEQVSVTWKITHEALHETNPGSSAFIVDGNTIACVWPLGSCEVTGTTQDGLFVRVSVYAYAMPLEFTLKPSADQIMVGSTQYVNIICDAAGYDFGEVEWWVDEEGFFTYQKTTNSTATNIITGKKPGTTTIHARLLNGATASCTVTVYDPNARVPGDANKDGAADLFDALLVLQYDAGWSVSIDARNADVNADGLADLFDALLILQYDAGWDVTLQ